MSKPKKKVRLDILNHATQLFARLGYHGMSMRGLATAVGVTPAALYHHFKNKDELYIQTVNKVFAEKNRAAKAIMADHKEPTKKLETFIVWLVRTLNKDKDFRKLLHWVLLDSNSKRVQRLTKHSFQELISLMQNLGESFKQRYDPHLLAVSILGLILYHFESGEVGSNFVGEIDVGDRADIIAHHVTSLLENGLLTN
jgi:TetR/AcrR family transcriptional regulator